MIVTSSQAIVKRSLLHYATFIFLHCNFRWAKETLLAVSNFHFFRMQLWNFLHTSITVPEERFDLPCFREIVTTRLLGHGTKDIQEKMLSTRIPSHVRPKIWRHYIIGTGGHCQSTICTNDLCLQYPRLHLEKTTLLSTAPELPSCGYKHPKQFSRPMPQLPSIDLHGHDNGKLNQSRWPQMSGKTFKEDDWCHMALTSSRVYSTKFSRSKSSVMVKWLTFLLLWQREAREYFVNGILTTRVTCGVILTGHEQ